MKTISFAVRLTTKTTFQTYHLKLALILTDQGCDLSVKVWKLAQITVVSVVWWSGPQLLGPNYWARTGVDKFGGKQSNSLINADNEGQDEPEMVTFINGTVSRKPTAAIDNRNFQIIPIICFLWLFIFNWNLCIGNFCLFFSPALFSGSDAKFFISAETN